MSRDYANAVRLLIAERDAATVRADKAEALAEELAAKCDGLVAQLKRADLRAEALSVSLDKALARNHELTVSVLRELPDPAARESFKAESSARGRRLGLLAVERRIERALDGAFFGTDPEGWFVSVNLGAHDGKPVEGRGSSVLEAFRNAAELLLLRVGEWEGGAK